MLIAGYIAALIMGITLGLIGAGGSILTVPVLTYLFYLPVHTATMYSLFIVGVAALFGTISYIRSNSYSLKTILYFGIPSIFSIYLTRTVIIHWIPENLFEIGNTMITKDMATMLLFSILMIAASFSMIKTPKVLSAEDAKEPLKYRSFFILMLGIIIGFIAGLLGAGGGFMIIPALVVLANLPMKTAIGTSLTIIGINSVIGFTGDLLYCTSSIDWKFLLIFTSIAIIGIFIGTKVSKYISGARLKPAFGWFILIMGLLIITEEIIK